MNAEAVVLAASDYVRIVIRRPHAYFFLKDILPELRPGGLATPKGMVRADGTIAPLPGVYVLSADGDLEGYSRLTKAGLLELLE